jgi:thioredoxin reductase
MQHDAIVIGGGFAGLAAATYLARARRSVYVIDTRQPRNRFADASHGFLGQDGADPRQILAEARDQVAAYPTIRMIEGEAVKARAESDGFSVVLSRRRGAIGYEGNPRLRAARHLAGDSWSSGALGQDRAALPLLPRDRVQRP